jgi:osmotically-inducible protein OsmY
MSDGVVKMLTNEKQRILKTASSVVGVKNVVDKIELKGRRV